MAAWNGRFRPNRIQYCQSLILLTSGAWLELDLLRRRREELGLIELSTLPVARLLRQGSVVGGGVVVVALVLFVVVVVQWRMALQYKAQLAPFALQSDTLRQKESITAAEIAATKNLNVAIANAVAGIRSGSALLTELQRLAPEALRFQLVTTKGNAISLEGDVLEPFAVQTLNAFQLRLDESSFFAPDGFALERATRGAGDVTPRLTFRFNGSFSADAIPATRSRLAELGTPGLVKRLDRLRLEELLP